MPAPAGSTINVCRPHAYGALGQDAMHQGPCALCYSCSNHIEAWLDSSVVKSFPPVLFCKNSNCMPPRASRAMAWRWPCAWRCRCWRWRSLMQQPVPLMMMTWRQSVAYSGCACSTRAPLLPWRAERQASGGLQYHNTLLLLLIGEEACVSPRTACCAGLAWAACRWRTCLRRRPRPSPSRARRRTWRSATSAGGACSSALSRCQNWALPHMHHLLPPCMLWRA